MAKSPTPRMLPPSQRQKRHGEEHPDFDKNTRVAGALVAAWGEKIHSFNEFVRGKGAVDAASTLIVLIHPDAIVGPMWPLAQHISNDLAISAEGVEFLGMGRSEFEEALGKTLPDLLKETRSQLDANEAIQDGYPVVVILGDVLWIGTSTIMTQAN